MKRLLFVACCFFCFNIANAQIGIKINGDPIKFGKKKNKQEENKPAGVGNESNATPETGNTVIVKQKNEWYLIYGSGQGNDWKDVYSTQALIGQNNFTGEKRKGLFSPYFSIKNTAEPNNKRRFMKDYPEWQAYIQPADKLGKIYFSTGQNMASASNSKTAFTSADMIYGTLEVNGKSLTETFQLPKQASSFGRNEDLYSLRLAIQFFNAENGNYIGGAYNLFWGEPMLLSESELKANKLYFDLRPAPDKTYSIFSDAINWNSQYTYGGILINNILKYIKKEGDYRVVVCLSNPYLSKDGFGNEIKNQWNEAYGEFTLTVRESDLAQLKTDKNLINERVYSLMHSGVLPESFAKPGTTPDATLSLTQLKAAIQNTYGSNYIIHKVVFENNSYTGWTIETDNIGLPREKRLNRRVLFTYTNKTDGKCYVNAVVPRRKYAGGGKYGSLEMGPSSFDKIIIECKSAK